MNENKDCARTGRVNRKEVLKLKKLDKDFSVWIKRLGVIEIKPQHKQSPFEALAESIVYQQLTSKAAATIYGRVKALFPGKKIFTPEDILKISAEKLRGAGLSQAKMLAMKDLAQKTLEGIVPTHRQILKMSNEEIIERLVQIRGIGQWTVEMLLIFKLGRSDVLPCTDYGVRKGFAKVYRKRDLPHPKVLAKYGERWAPHRTTAALYLWRALDSEKQQRQQPEKKSRDKR